MFTFLDRVLSDQNRIKLCGIHRVRFYVLVTSLKEVPATSFRVRFVDFPLPQGLCETKGEPSGTHLSVWGTKTGPLCPL
ncbi:hypothetical protein JOB18_001947 [Solea senegalensis]|uniref:Uncharacterized protein n=1 Tax=Solea senegalensis TaxID=28829 RepID=A0AAV6RRE8_SOLSE|nr:hypothetical protein JOB18_001947 [Solea senegalensis]